MKSRQGFVSNSSSSSYIVQVPKGFQVRAEDLEKYKLEDIYESEVIAEDDLEAAAEWLNKYLTMLAEGKEYYRGEYYRSQPDLFNDLMEILEQEGMVVMGVDGTGGSGEDSIIPFKDQRLEKK